MATENSSIRAVKSWLFPSIVSILAAVIWHDVNEIKSDVKQLMAQSNIDKTRIDNLERILYKSALINTVSIPNPPNKLPSHIVYHEMVGIKPEEDEDYPTKRKLLEYF